MNKDIKKVLVSEKEINKRCVELGKQLAKDYEGKNPVFVGLLKGSVPFLAEIIKRIDIDIEVDFMDVSSYEGTDSTEVRILKDVESSLQGRDVLIIEDIIDTGKTLAKVTVLFSLSKTPSIN